MRDKASKAEKSRKSFVRIKVDSSKLVIGMRSEAT